ncbi:hypothetical protein CpipJ_CPIJ009422 [Culex quinquefasciatus]|uniref:Uncharacterized protein n=1 Tax=Culex quinquefasciatus TaxID=7176 RepID=B0WQV7_CULQU|nr:hypothetical protein CpipJ_CPIJ009422 [Culex quinquefasciatus]|eukprot:XP_001851091.1 hypothetical protein CpipJ_CPIJ009422 [Culex quinquefasciatus]
MAGHSASDELRTFQIPADFWAPPPVLSRRHVSTDHVAALCPRPPAARACPGFEPSFSGSGDRTNSW